MYVMNRDGVIRQVENIEPTYNYAVFLYESQDDISKIDGESPLVYKTLDSMIKDLMIENDIKGWLNDAQLTIVIRKIPIKLG